MSNSAGLINRLSHPSTQPVDAGDADPPKPDPTRRLPRPHAPHSRSRLLQGREVPADRDPLEAGGRPRDPAPCLLRGEWVCVCVFGGEGGDDWKDDMELFSYFLNHSIRTKINNS